MATQRHHMSLPFHITQPCLWLTGGPALFSSQSNVYFPFLGTLPVAAQYGPLAVGGLRHGTVNQRGFIDWVTLVFNGRLHVHANYDSNVFGAALMRSLVAGRATAAVHCPLCLCSTVLVVQNCGAYYHHPKSTFLSNYLNGFSSKWIAREGVL